MWYISHHGIKGQHWGVSNGPPYPLAAGAHNASERKAGYRSSLGKGSKGKSKSTNKEVNTNKETSENKFQLTDKQKKL